VPEDRERTYSWQDPQPSGPAARERDGLSFLQAILAGELPAPPIGRTLGFRWHSVEAGRVVFELQPQEFHLNPLGTVHGGVYATLLDSACGCAVQSLLPAGAHYTSLDLTVKFLRPLQPGGAVVRCEGSVIHLGSRTALAQAVLADGEGRQYGHATSSCLVFRPDA
jgi:uncharacterized protein (TIGR00369 family)